MHGGFHTCAKGVPLRSKVAAIITVFLLGVGLLVFIMVQMQNYASIINDAGVVRGATQRAVKLEIADMPNEDVVERVDEVLASLIDREDQRPLKSRETREFEDALFRIEDEWGLIKQEFAEPSPSEERLLALSEEHFRLADTTVFLAQRRAESDFLWIAAVGSLLICGASLFVSLLERHHRLKLRKALVTDPLTGGRNQFSFEEEAQRLVQAAGAGAYLVAYSNVVGFRSVNESFGRMAGDGVIRTLNALFEKACGPDELVGHVNADHFVMLLRNDENRMEQVAAQTAARLRADDALPFSDRIVCGYGTYELADGGEDIATAVSNASVVLKEGTITNLIARYDDAFRAKLAFERHVEERMRKALAAGEFAVYVQPQFFLDDGSLAGVEALCRWDSPDLGLLMPDRFIPQFERNGFIADLDFFMLERTCRLYPLTAQTKPGGGPVHVAVNFSRVTMLQNDFVERFERLVGRFDFPPAFLHVEVTESALTADDQALVGILSELRRHGFPIAMDDFGTGYSSLSLLRNMPIDVLKIDRSFLSASEDDERSRRVLEHVLALANDLGIDTVCEGIETAEQADLLRRLGCSIGQGFHLARPMPLGEFRARFASDGTTPSAS